MSDKASPVKNMAYWNGKNGPAAASPGKYLQAIAGAVGAVKDIKKNVDSLTGKTAMTDAMNAPISSTASGKEKEK